MLGRLYHKLVLPFKRPLVSAFKAVHGSDPVYTRKKDTVDSQFCLDYVFTGGALRPKAASIGAMTYCLLDGLDFPFLPNAEWPSDHLPIVVDLVE